MKKFVDIDSLIPEEKGVRFSDKNGQVYELDLFIPVAASLIRDKYKDDIDGAQGAFLECVLSKQLDYMTIEWMEENLSLDVQNALYSTFIFHVNMSEKNTIDMLTGGMTEKKSQKTKKTFWEKLFRR